MTKTTWVVCNNYDTQHTKYVSHTFTSRKEASQWMNRQYAKDKATWLLCKSLDANGIMHVVERTQ